jgi:hypothetical protein
MKLQHKDAYVLKGHHQKTHMLSNIIYLTHI